IVDFATSWCRSNYNGEVGRFPAAQPHGVLITRAKAAASVLLHQATNTMTATRRTFLATGLAAAVCAPLRPATLLAQVAKTGPADSKAKGATEASGKHGPRLGDERTETYRIGVVFSAEKGACTGLLATVPMPMDWPEQTVTVINEEKTSL